MQNQTAMRFGVATDTSPDHIEYDQIEKVSFAALYVFALLLYLRPQEMFPSVFGEFPIVKLVALLALAAFIVGRIRRGERITVWPLELKMLAVMIVLSVALVPLAAAPGDSYQVMSDPFLKVVTIFVLMINLIVTRRRLTSILNVIVVVGSIMALAAVRSYMAGEFTLKSTRIAGMVNGLFGNPNDLATSLDLLIPFALALALINRGGKRLFYLLCGTALTAGVVVTFSRGGFLGLLAMAAFCAWKLGRFRKGVTALVLAATIAIFIVAVPASYGGRLGSIFNVDSDATGSAQARLDLLVRASEVAASHPIIGVGLGNFHIYSIGEQKAHNSYLEIAAELGIAGLIAYLIILIAPFRYLKRIERESADYRSRSQAAGTAVSHQTRVQQKSPPHAGDVFYLSVMIQAALIGFAVCSFFGSIEYFWDLYLIVAYAISLKRITERESCGDRTNERANPKKGGVLWSGRPALQGELT